MNGAMSQKTRFASRVFNSGTSRGSGKLASGTQSKGTGKQEAQVAKANGKGRGKDSPGWLVAAAAYARVVGSVDGAGGAGAIGGGANL